MMEQNAKETVMEQIRRIRNMEDRLNRLNSGLKELKHTLDIFEEAYESARILEAYYSSELWRRDFEADESGLLPVDLLRGVLSEDGIDHALSDYRELTAAYRILTNSSDPNWELRSARYLASDMLRRTVKEGDTVVDATMGNGHDTQLLCSLVGKTGRVYSFDVQQRALDSTRKLLESDGLMERAILLNVSHDHLAEYIPGSVKAVVFNLGWLPGGDHGITTIAETTLRAVEQALAMLLPSGLLTLCAYPGHSEGKRELELLTRYFSSLSSRKYNVLQHVFLNAGQGAPVCFAVQKQHSDCDASRKGSDKS